MKILIKNAIVTIGLISLTLISNGCLSNKLVLVSDDNRDAATEKLNRAAKSREGRIALQNGDTLQVKNIAIRGDSVFWHIKETGSTAGALLSEIKTISIRKRNTSKGLGHGFLIGAGIGVSYVGYFILKDSEDFDCDGADSFCFTKGEAMTAGIVVLGVPFGLFGMIHGAATKTSETYDFDDKETMEK
ncbi:hypothetical protein IH879_14060 [candidate division KSB1 bacterium]|nr:hypothetical protein [candidate division KSB1 bacterium]